MDNPKNPPLASTVDDASKRLGIGRSKLYQLIREGQLRSFKIGVRTMIAESELQRFVSKCMEAAA